MRGPRAAALMAGLALPLVTTGGAAAQEAEESTAITTLYTSLLGGVGKGIGSEGFSWAMSAIGLSGGESEQLAAISIELQQIDADLKNINATLNAILNAIQDQTCNETQIAPSLQDAVNDVTDLYNKYQTFLTNAARTPPVPPSQEQVLGWQNDVLANVSRDLNAIHNGVYATVSANVIHQCAVSTAGDWRTANPSPIAATFLDDRPSYAQLINIVNYYYGVQVQGATILAEAHHLRACQAAAQNDADLHCDFTTASTSTSPSEIDELCETSTDPDVERACLAAEESVTDTDTGTGVYERVEAWLKAAGAPYATGQLGIISSIAVSSSGSAPPDWSSSYAYLFPRDLLDFTNKATINGETVSDCASPLISTAPCGLTVGRYDLTLSSELSYGGINGHWKPATAEVLLLLLDPYNHQRFGTTSGTLGDFMASIGFSATLKTSGLIITTPTTGKNKFSGAQAICLMDTSAPLNKAKQPWCDGIEGQVQGTDDLIQQNTQLDSRGCIYTEPPWVGDLTSQPKFYVGEYHACGTNTWETEPGWLVGAQDTSDTSKRAIFWQYHWPMTNVPEIGCQNGKPYTNPGGLLSRCAGDLQEYVDALLPPPESDTTALAASGDATLSPEEPNRNFGEDPLLILGGRDGRAFVVQFEDARIQGFVEGGALTSAILRLSVAERGSPTRLEIEPVLEGFVEGKGSVGTGVTWNCAEEADISDDVEDCLQQWPPSLVADGYARRPDQHDRRAGLLGWDVTEDVNAGVYAWAIRAASGYKGGHRGTRGGAFHAHQGAAELREPFRAPTLLLQREPAMTGTEQLRDDAGTMADPQQTPMMPLERQALEPAAAAGQ